MYVVKIQINKFNFWKEHACAFQKIASDFNLIALRSSDNIALFSEFHLYREYKVYQYKKVCVTKHPDLSLCVTN